MKNLIRLFIFVSLIALVVMPIVGCDTSTVTISNVVLTPPSPATLNYGNYVIVNFDYSSSETGNILIFTMPRTNGVPSPNYVIFPPPDYPPGQGSGYSQFRLQSQSGQVIVDQLHLLIQRTDYTVIYETFIPVNYIFQ